MSAEQGQIQELAYRLWQEAGSPHGQDWSFWLKAETQIKTTAAKPKATKAPGKAKAEPKPKAPAKPKAAPKNTAAKPKAAAKV